MFMTKFRQFVFLCTLIAAAAVGSFAQNVTVAGEIAGGPVKKGKAATAKVTLEMSSELHVNSNRPSKDYLIATTVKPTAKGLVLGRVKYPVGHDRKFSFSADPLNVYEGKVEFSFVVTVPRRFRGNEVSVDVAVRYQACTDEVCFPPRTKTVTLTAPVE